MQIPKLWKARLLLIILGLSSLDMAVQDSADGEATRTGMNIKESENPTLFEIEIIKKYGFGVFLIGLGLFIREKKDSSDEDE
ncbi:MAG: hypothetical protein ACJA2G_003505 [Cognaticolwellia sp.]|jgi:hypothetical protein